MRVILERYQSWKDTVTTDTVTIEDARWTGELSRLVRDWCAVSLGREQPEQEGAER